MNEGPILVFATRRYGTLGERVVAEPGFERGEVERRFFPDGERYQRILSECAGRDVAIVGGTITDEDTLEIYDLACGLVHLGVHTLTLVLPFFGYQTMERAVQPGEVVVAKTRAQLLSSIPMAGSGNRVVMVDLHSEGITQYFSGDVQPVHLSALPVVRALILELAGDAPFVIGATDAGRAKWVEHLANELGVDAGFVFKRRLGGAQTAVTALAADVRGKTVIVYDDMIRTGSSLLGAARAYLDAGATRVSAVCTHGVFPGDALSRLSSSGLLETIACTDTHPGALAAHEAGLCRVASVAPLLADHLQRRGALARPRPTGQRGALALARPRPTEKHR
jgi:ribose-phosphate pyrophosphokinase